MILQRCSVRVLVRHLPTALDEDKEHKSSKRLSTFHFLSCLKMSKIETNSSFFYLNEGFELSEWIVKKFLPVFFCADCLREGSCFALMVIVLLSCLWSFFVVSSPSARPYIAEMRSILSGDSLRHKNLSTSSTTLKPLVSFWLSALNVIMVKKTKHDSWMVKKHH